MTFPRSFPHFQTSSNVVLWVSPLFGARQFYWLDVESLGQHTWSYIHNQGIFLNLDFDYPILTLFLTLDKNSTLALTLILDSTTKSLLQVDHKNSHFIFYALFDEHHPDIRLLRKEKAKVQLINTNTNAKEA